MLLMRNSVFVHIPKCGGTSVRHELERLGLAIAELGPPGSDRPASDDSPYRADIKHAKVSDVRDAIADRVVLASVRETVAWYRSMWCFRKRASGSELLAFEEEGPLGINLWRETFPAWVDTITTVIPGLYGTVLNNMLEGVMSCSDHLLLRTSRLNADLQSALITCGEIKPSTETAVPKLNVTTDLKEEALLSRGVLRMIRESEGDGDFPDAFRYSDSFVS